MQTFYDYELDGAANVRPGDLLSLQMQLRPTQYSDPMAVRTVEAIVVAVSEPYEEKDGLKYVSFEYALLPSNVDHTPDTVRGFHSGMLTNLFADLHVYDAVYRVPNFTAREVTR